jgi:arsenate reductase
MAAAFFNALADPRRARAISAGTSPAERVHPEVVAAMREVGLDLGGARPQQLTAVLAGEAQWLVTMGCGEDCPVVAGVQRVDWTIPDPKGQPLADVRRIRDEIRARVTAFVSAQGWSMQWQDPFPGGSFPPGRPV